MIGWGNIHSSFYTERENGTDLIKIDAVFSSKTLKSLAAQGFSDKLWRRRRDSNSR
jgi:hypothetical protein